MFNNTSEETMKKNEADFDIIHAQGVFQGFNGEELAAFTSVFKESAWQEWSEAGRRAMQEVSPSQKLVPDPGTVEPPKKCSSQTTNGPPRSHG